MATIHPRSRFIHTLLKLWIFIFSLSITKVSGVLEYKDGNPYKVGCFEIKNELLGNSSSSNSFQDCYNFENPSNWTINKEVEIEPLTDLTYVIASQNSTGYYCNKIQIPSSENYQKYIESKFVQKELHHCGDLNQTRVSFKNNDSSLYKVYCSRKNTNRLICDILFSLPLIQNLSPLSSHDIEVVAECGITNFDSYCMHLNHGAYLEPISPAHCLNYCKKLLPSNNQGFYSIISGFSPNASYLNYVYKQVPLPFTESQTPEWTNCNCYNCSNQFEEFNSSSCTNCPNSDYKCGNFGSNGYTLYSIYKLGQIRACSTTWKGNPWIAYSTGLASQNCSGGNATWECRSDGFEGVPNVSNCTFSCIQDFDEDIQQIPGTINVTESEILMNKFESNIKNQSYYGHEIEQVLKFGVDITQKLDDKINFESLKNITKRNINIFGEVITNQEAWAEILDNNERAKAGTMILENTEILANRVAKALETNNLDSIELADPEQPIQVTVGIIKDYQNQTFVYPMSHRVDEAFIEVEIMKKDSKSLNPTPTFIGIKMEGSKTNSILSNYHKDLGATKTKCNSGIKRCSGKGRSTSILPKIGVTINGDTTYSENIQINIPKPEYIPRSRKRSKRDTDTLELVEETGLILDYDRAICVYWDMKNSFWSPEGCTRENHETYLLCQCNKFGLYSVVVSYEYVDYENGPELLPEPPVMGSK